MKNGDFYMHFKGGEYYFECIALPLRDKNLGGYLRNQIDEIGIARYHDNTHDLKLFNFNGVTFIDSDLPHVIYQSDQHYNSTFVWARELDDFFGYKQDEDGNFIKRFTLK